MDSLLSNDVILEKRSTPYYGKYLYCAKFYLHGVSKTRFVRTISNYKIEISNILNETKNYKASRRVAIETWIKQINFDEIKRFLQLKAKWRQKNRKKEILKIVVDHTTTMFLTLDRQFKGSTVKLYSNDLTLFEDFIVFSNLKIYESEHVGNREIMYFKRDPKTKYRLYFKDYRVMDHGLRPHIKEMLKYNDDLYPSDSLTDWLNMSNLYYSYYLIKKSYYFGFNDEATFTTLQLSLDTNILGRYYELRKIEMINSLV